MSKREKELKEFGENIWVGEGPCVNFFSFPYPTRMVVIRLPNNSLWIWSPIKLNDTIKSAIAKIGAPAHLISPNKLHYLFLQEWKDAYPSAKIYGLPSVIRKCKRVTFDEILIDDPPDDWQGVISQVIVHGSFLLDEIVFFHAESKTAIFADLTQNFTEEFINSTAGWTPWRKAIARIWKITEPYGWAPLEWRLSFVHRKLARLEIYKIINWIPDNVIMAHGKYIKNNGVLYIKKAFSWLVH